MSPRSHYNNESMENICRQMCVLGWSEARGDVVDEWLNTDGGDDDVDNELL